MYNRIVHDMYNNPLYADIHIKLHSGEILYAHKFVLCNLSDMIAGMMNNNFNEATTGEIEFIQSDNVVKNTISKLYCDKYLFNINVYKILKFMHFLQVKEHIINHIVDDYQHTDLNTLVKISMLYSELMPGVSRVALCKSAREISHCMPINIQYESYVYLLKYFNRPGYKKFNQTINFVILYCKHTNNIEHLREFLLSLISIQDLGARIRCGKKMFEYYNKLRTNKHDLWYVDCNRNIVDIIDNKYDIVNTIECIKVIEEIYNKILESFRII
jgi:hypothetical protein